jgi:hypothetical protein
MKYLASSNTLYLMNDGGTSWGTGGAPGSSGTLTNSQCSISLAATTAMPSGNNLTVSPSLTFTTTYQGGKYLYMDVIDLLGETSNWQNLGIFMVGSAAEAPPTVVSGSPTSGKGTSQQFTWVVSSAGGASNLSAVYINFEDTEPFCTMKYVVGTNMLYLASDSNGAWGTGAQPGSSGALMSSRCVVTMATTTVTRSGNMLTLSVSLGFQAAYTSPATVEVDAIDVLGESSGYVVLGEWAA